MNEENTVQQWCEEVVFTPDSVRELREELLQSDELERTAFVKCARSGNRLLVKEVRPVPDEKMIRQGWAECRPELELERREIYQPIDEGWYVLHVHSHPFANHPRFSTADHNIMPKLARWTDQMCENTDILFAVLGQEAIQVTWYDPSGATHEPIPVTILGNWDLNTPLEDAADTQTRESPTGDDIETDIRDEKYDRNIRVYGEEGQERLSEAEVTVVGVGGIGSVIAVQAARVGIGQLNLVDPDQLELSNLPRVYGSDELDIGRPKVEILSEQLERIASGLTVTTHKTVVEAEDVAPVLKRSDAVIAGLDQMRSRSYLNQYCVRHGIPYIDAGVVINTESETEAERVQSKDGFIQTVIPGTTACFDCLDRIDPQQTRIERLPEDDVEVEVEEGYVEGTALTPEPAVVPLNTTVAGMAVTELVAYLTGARPPRGFLHYQGVEADISQLDGRKSRSETCPTCGEGGILFKGDVTQVSNIELPDNVDDELSSIPTPANADKKEPDGSEATLESDQDSESEAEAPVETTPTNSQSGEKRLDLIDSFRTYSKEVLPWK